MRQVAQALGFAGVLGVGVALFCAAFYWSALAPALRELATARVAAAAAAAVRPEPAVPADDALTQLYARFPPLEALPAQVQHLHRLGRRAGLQLHRAEYRLDAHGPGLASYGVSLPVRGPYRALRLFLGQVLEDMPVASIDRLRFERQKPADTELDAQIHLTMFFRPSPGGTPP